MATDLGHEEKNINKKLCRVKNMKYRLLSTVMFGVLFFGMLPINLKCFYNSIHAKLALFCCLWKAIAVRIGCTKYILYTLKYILNESSAHMLFKKMHSLNYILQYAVWNLFLCCLSETLTAGCLKINGNFGRIHLSGITGATPLHTRIYNVITDSLLLITK